MADRETPRFLPNHRSAAQAATRGTSPHWFIREAPRAFDLELSDIAVFVAIADNLDSAGVSRSALSLIADRIRAHRSTVVRSVATLVDHGLLIELDEKRPGVIMRYAIPAEMPWPRR